MEKRRGKPTKYAYFLISIVLLALIVSEISQVENYHSSYGSLDVDVTNYVAHFNQTDYIVIAKLPGVSVNVKMYLQAALPPPNEHIAVIVPTNNSVASISLDDFNTSNSIPSITVKFNSTSHFRNFVHMALGQNINATLTHSSPVSIMTVPVGELQGFSPAIVKSPQYDFLIIQVNNTATLQYTEVSR